ncbi:ectopic P granules protein 5 homolog isoform X2 [Limulus polyphemus]|uniref:Ectopic P granules protein 5 homolog isoform X2 n=1 Tax=Limulus polyphemus TaxID=6850 RepID=A0ABM1T0S7_LIMPO|nr:ectopic P granules protein 5 homolog isoform X2 [Limulus polyphemus]
MAEAVRLKPSRNKTRKKHHTKKENMTIDQLSDKHGELEGQEISNVGFQEKTSQLTPELSEVEVPTSVSTVLLSDPVVTAEYTKTCDITQVEKTKSVCDEFSAQVQSAPLEIEIIDKMVTSTEAAFRLSSETANAPVPTMSREIETDFDVTETEVKPEPPLTEETTTEPVASIHSGKIEAQLPVIDLSHQEVTASSLAELSKEREPEEQVIDTTQSELAAVVEQTLNEILVKVESQASVKDTIQSELTTEVESQFCESSTQVQTHVETDDIVQPVQTSVSKSKVDVELKSSTIQDLEHAAYLTEKSCDKVTLKKEMRRPKVSHRFLYPHLTEEVKELEYIRPYTESQLLCFYQNLELQKNDAFIEDFIQSNRNVECHEFYELLLGYFRARCNLINTSEEVSELQKKYGHQRERLWSMIHETASRKGQCADKKNVTGVHSFVSAKYNSDVGAAVEEILRELRETIQEIYTLYAYSAQMSRIQVDSYIFNLISLSPVLKDIPSNAPVSGFSPETLNPAWKQQINSLKICISILFMFQRRQCKDTQFVEDTRYWLTSLVAILLRVSTFDDHLFLLNHILRCPPGTGHWAASYIQPINLSNWSFFEETEFGSLYLDHVVTTLATLLFPVKARMDFLLRLKSSKDNDSAVVDPVKDSVWVLVDSEGEEDEDQENQWFHWLENDIVAFLNQIPIATLFRHILLIEAREDVDHYDIRCTTPNGMLKILAFSTQLLNIFREGLKNFHLRRYRQLTKRISRLIRHTIQYVSDHWLNFRESNLLTDQALMLRLQVEFDQFFLRAVNCIFSSQCLGAWQFMAVLPYTCVSAPMMWRLLWLLHNNYQEEQVVAAYDEENWKARVEDKSLRSLFEDNLRDMEESEAFYLLTAFANMAASRSEKEMSFVETVAIEIFEISFVNQELREMLCKEGRDLLASLSQKHPAVVSSLLSEVQEHFDSLGTMALYLFRVLSLKQWQPLDQDLDVISNWLISNPLSSPQNQLARVILCSLNWGPNQQGTDLYLSKDIHRRVALSVVEAYSKYGVRWEKGGLVHQSFQQLTQLITMSATAAMTTTEQGFTVWAWDLLLTLRLHLCDSPKTNWRDVIEWRDISLQTLPDLHQSSWLHSLLRAVQDKQPVACYVAIAMTTVGHSTEALSKDGFRLLTALMLREQYIPAIHVLCWITLVFVKNIGALMTNKSFLSDLQYVVTADVTYMSMAKNLVSPEFPGTVLHRVAAMLVYQLHTVRQQASDLAEKVLKLWLQVLSQLPDIGNEKGGLFGKLKGQDSVFFLLDVITKVAFLDQSLLHSLMNTIKEISKAPEKILEEPVTPVSSGGVFSSLASFISSGGGNKWPSLLPLNPLPKFPWFAWSVLCVETNESSSSSLWKGILQELERNPEQATTVAIKKVATALKLPIPPIDQLPIYRWAQQAVSTPLDSPILPLLWQKFFTFYLQRVPRERGAPVRGSLGNRFFDMGYFSVLKKLKRRLNETADWYHKKYEEAVIILEKLENVEIDSDEEVFANDDSRAKLREKKLAEVVHNDKLMRLYRTFSLWLEEPRLHDPKLCIPALPPQYNPDLLNIILQDNQESWLEYINREEVQKDIDDLKLLWETEKKSLHYQIMSSGRSHAQEDDSATARILSRLRSYDDPLPPPIIPKLKPPVPQVTDGMFQNDDILETAVKTDLKIFCDQARNFACQSSKLLALDCTYLELVPQLYRNEDAEVVLHVACEEHGKCSGPASIRIQFCEAKLLGRFQYEMEINRSEEFDLLTKMLQPPPKNVCTVAVHAENCITMLLRKWQEVKNGQDHNRQEMLRKIGVSLFYHQMSLIDNVTCQYPPTKQFFTSCLDVLGQGFIVNDGKQCLHLLKAILTEPTLVGLVATFFSPRLASSDTYIHMYDLLANSLTTKSVNTCFVLLSKFDLPAWLSCCKRKLSERSGLITIIGKALAVIGSCPDEQMLLLFDLYRHHLRLLTMYQFPDHYGDVIQLLLKGMDTHTLSLDVWYDFLLSLGVTIKPGERNTTVLGLAIKEYAYNQKLFPKSQLQDTLLELGKYFWEKRQQLKKQGLYSKYQKYIVPLSTFLGVICEARVVAEATRSNQNTVEKVVQDTWKELYHVFQPWIHPFMVDGKFWLPWLPGDTESASLVFQTFVSSLSCLHEWAKGANIYKVHSYVWEYYITTFAHKTLKETILNVCHMALSELTWSEFFPTPKDVELMSKIVQDEVTECVPFLRGIFLQVSWSNVVQHLINTESQEIMTVVLNEFAHLVFRLFWEPHIFDVHAMKLLLVQAESYPWHILDSQAVCGIIERAFKYMDPRTIMMSVEKEQPSEIQFLALSLVKIICGVAKIKHNEETRELVSKRVLYIRNCVDLVNKYASKNSKLLQKNPDIFCNFVSGLFTETESIASTGSVPSNLFSEAVEMITECLGILNNCPLPLVQELALNSLLSWIKNNSKSVLILPLLHSACRLASVSHLVSVIETCITSFFFSSPEMLPPDGGWSQIVSFLHVPQLTLRDFLSTCVAENAHLTLFAYQLQRLPHCQSIQEEQRMLEQLVDWCGQAKPSEQNEPKVLLLWDQVINLAIRQIDYGGNVKFVGRFLANFSTSLLVLGEDRSSTGILGVVGFGRKSSFSLRYRFMCRTLAVFLLLQLPVNAPIRLTEYAPGHPRLPPGNGGKPSSQAANSLSLLEGLRNNKQYLPVKAELNMMVSFILDAKNNLRDGTLLIKQLAASFYPNLSYLKIIK